MNAFCAADSALIFSETEMSDDSPQNASDYSSDAPLVSIIILNLNKPDMTIDCLKSIWKNTTGIPYEVIVVDNGSSPENQKRLAAYEGPHKFIPLAINRFFGEGNNIGAEFAKGTYLLFLNNDVIVTPDWLPPLVDVFDTHPDAGCVGPKFIYPSGELQEAGVLLDPEGFSVQIGKFQSPDQPRFNRMRVVDYVSAATVLMRKADFYAVLGFDFRYEPAYYEDCDLCLKIGTLGKKTYYVPRSEVIHHENATTADKSLKDKLNNIVEVNQAKFIDRWRNFLTTGVHDGKSYIAPLLPARVASARKTAGIYTPYNIIPGGGERYLFSIMKVLAAQGYGLTLIVPELYSRLRISLVLDQLDLDLDGIDIITHTQAEAGAQFDLFYCLGNSLVPTSRAMGHINLFCCQFPFKTNEDHTRQHLSLLKDYDAVICYSGFVEQEIRKQLRHFEAPEPAIHVVAPPVGIVAEVDPQMAKSGILGIGRFFIGDHCKRQDEMVKAMKALSELGADTSLDLVGSLHPEPIHRDYLANCRQMARDLPVSFHIDAPVSVLSGLLQRASIYWHGAGLGVDVKKWPEHCEHFGISVVEAMSARVIPVVVNNGGPSTIVEDGISGFHYGSREELVQITRALLSYSEDKLTELRDNAQARAQLYSFAAFEARFADILVSMEKKASQRFETSSAHASVSTR